MATSDFRTAVCGDSPVLYTGMDDTSGFFDIEKKTGNLITATNSPTAPSDFDDGWTFDGVDQYLFIDADDCDQVGGWIGATGEFSIEVWIKMAPFDGAKRVLRWGPYGLFVQCYGFLAQADGYITAGFFDDLAAEKSVEHYGAYFDDAWHHVVVTFDGSALTLFVDGTEVESEIQNFIPHWEATGDETHISVALGLFYLDSFVLTIGVDKDLSGTRQGGGWWDPHRDHPPGQPHPHEQETPGPD